MCPMNFGKLTRLESKFPPFEFQINPLHKKISNGIPKFLF